MRERVSALGVEVAEQVGFYTRLVTALLAVGGQDKRRQHGCHHRPADQCLRRLPCMSKGVRGWSGRRSATSLALAVTASRLRCCSSSSPWRPRTPISNVSRAVASPAQRQLLNDSLASPVVAKVAAMEKLALDKAASGSFGVDAEALP